MEDIKKLMLGHNCNNVDVVVITPLGSTFRKLKKVLNIEASYDKCFFENCIFSLNENSSKGLLVLSPQGIAAKDIVELFSNTKILFFGLAGSINLSIAIGDFVEVKSVTDTACDLVDLFTIGRFPSVKCGYNPCLLGTIAKEHCDLAREMKCDVVDMETVYCSKIAKEKNNLFVALLLISDIPDVINFWELSNQDQITLKTQRYSALQIIVDYINVLSKIA